MGSLNSNGTPKTQSTNVFRHHHQGNFLQQTDTTADSGIAVSNSGVVSTDNYSYPFGLERAPTGRTFISGMPLSERDIEHHGAGSGIQYLDFLKQASGLTLEHKVTRGMGLFTSVSTRQDVGASGMVTVQERKNFFLDSDRGKSSGFADWNVFTADGAPTTAADGVTDIDFTPNATFDGGA